MKTGPLLESLSDEYRASLIYKLLDNVTVTGTGCFLWKRSLRSGYGRIVVMGTTHFAHRVSYALFRAPLIEGQMVLHKCDVSQCVNPSHLYQGTQSANVCDSYDRKRRASGECHHYAKLTELQVVEMRANYAAGASLGMLSRAFNVRVTAAGDAVSGKSWKHVQGAVMLRAPAGNRRLAACDEKADTLPDAAVKGKQKTFNE